MSCVVSYVILSLITLFYVTEYTLTMAAISIIVNVIMALIFSCVYKSDVFNSFLLKRFNKTASDDIWHDVFDFKHGSNIKVYFKDKDYYVIGAYRLNEDKGNDSWFAISGYQKYNRFTNEEIEHGFLDDENVIMTFKLSDVEHIEIF